MVFSKTTVLHHLCYQKNIKDVHKNTIIFTHYRYTNNRIGLDLHVSISLSYKFIANILALTTSYCTYFTVLKK